MISVNSPSIDRRQGSKRLATNDSVHVVCVACQTTNRLPAARLGQGPRCGRCKRPLFNGEPAVLDRAGFGAQINGSDTPVVVDFWAPWCGPCKMMAPAFAQAAARLEPRVRLAKVNTEDEPELSARYGIRSIPTLMIFEQGREVARQAGAMDLGHLLRWIEDNL